MKIDDGGIKIPELDFNSHGDSIRIRIEHVSAIAIFTRTKVIFSACITEITQVHNNYYY